MPALIVGTSSDRIGTPHGRSFYAAINKDLTEAVGLPVAPYVGYSYGHYEGRGRVIGGVRVAFTDRSSSSPSAATPPARPSRRGRTPA